MLNCETCNGSQLHGSWLIQRCDLCAKLPSDASARALCGAAYDLQTALAELLDVAGSLEPGAYDQAKTAARKALAKSRGK